MRAVLLSNQGKDPADRILRLPAFRILTLFIWTLAIAGCSTPAWGSEHVETGPDTQALRSHAAIVSDANRGHFIHSPGANTPLAYDAEKEPPSALIDAEFQDGDPETIHKNHRPTQQLGISSDPPPPPPPKDVLERVPKRLYTSRPARALAPAAVPGIHRFADSKTLVLIYSIYRKNPADPTPTDFVTPGEVEILRHEVDLSRTFVWRHSHAKFNLQVTDFVVIDRELTLDQFWALSAESYWLPYWSVDGQHSVTQDMTNLGLIDVGYDAVIVLYAWRNTAGAVAAYGGAAYGVGIPALNGAAYVAIPLEWGIEGKHGVIVHEYLHVLDSLFAASGEPDFPHADRPRDYSGDYNFGWEFNAWMLQTWPLDKWLNTGVYATIATARDADEDGLPDQGHDGAGIPLSVTEVSFGSSPGDTDTDGDGLSDMLEMVAEVFDSSNPVIADTDGDGLPDGEDAYPLFPVKTDRIRGTPTIDGILGNNEHHPLGTVRDATGTDLDGEVYFEWDNNYLYVSARVVDDYVDGFFSEPWWNDHLVVRIDASNDGFQWHGDDNLEVFIGPKGVGGQPYAYPRILHADGTIDTTTIVESDLIYSTRITPTGYELELAIPAIPAIGLTPNTGYRAGYNAVFTDFDSLEWSWNDYDVISGRHSPAIAFADLVLTEITGTDEIEIDIDFRPWTKRNTINPRRRGRTWVAILGDAEFDVTLVDPRSMRLGPEEARPLWFWYWDTDRNGYADLLGWFKVRRAGIECGDETVDLTANTLDGQALAGTDKIRTVRCRRRQHSDTAPGRSPATHRAR